jgi:mono/diheme cytochrome c family protein
MTTRIVLLAALVVAAAVTRARAGADDGKALYDQKCKICHSIGGEGGKMASNGGPLDKVATKRDAKWLHDFIQDPKSKMPDAKMPKAKLDDKQLDDVVAYLMTLK